MSGTRFSIRVLLALGAVCAAPLAPSVRADEGTPLAGPVVSSAGVPAEVEEMYRKGLRFLAASQTAEGSFGTGGYDGQAGVVGLAGVAFLAHGDDPNTGPYAKNLRGVLGFILKNQRADGYIGDSMYNHGFATLFLAEAYGMVNDDRIGPALKKAVKLIGDAQAANGMGAWRYSPEATDADTTITGACTVALAAAANAGIRIPEDSLQKSLKYYRFCQDESGRIGYTGAGQGGTDALTAIGAVCHAVAKRKDATAYKRACACLANLPQEQSQYMFYGLYYRSQAAFHDSAEAWAKFNAANIAARRQDQADDGSWSGEGGPGFSTSAALLSLALNYRFLPIYER